MAINKTRQLTQVSIVFDETNTPVDLFVEWVVKYDDGSVVDKFRERRKSISFTAQEVSFDTGTKVLTVNKDLNG